MYFKSRFLHPVRHEPVLLWRWGRVARIGANDFTIDVRVPVFFREVEGRAGGDSQEAAEKIFGQKTIPWMDLIEVRNHVC
jgi:hypothetical protein